MTTFKASFRESGGSFRAGFNESKETFGADVGSYTKIETGNYNNLTNKPQIEGVTLEGDRSFKQLGMDTLSVQEIEKILYLD